MGVLLMFIPSAREKRAATTGPDDSFTGRQTRRKSCDQTMGRVCEHCSGAVSVPSAHRRGASGGLLADFGRVVVYDGSTAFQFRGLSRSV